MRTRSKAAAAGIALFSIAVTSLFLIDLCNLVYRCGCDHLWAGAAEHCNIHNRHAKHCPWCSIGLAGAGAVYLGIVVPQAVLAFHPSLWSWKRRLTASLLAFPLIGGVLGLALGLALGYWS